jgi:(p)ppGpp synthase/HD superfamily hydrolase
MTNTDANTATTELLARANAFATAAHEGQESKYGLGPYINHCRRVEGLLVWNEREAATPAMRAAALLHDTVEDTPVTLEDIGREFGPEVRRMVSGLSDVSRPGDGNRRVRKALDAAHLHAQEADVQRIKVADLTDNARTIRENDPKFWKVYQRECRALLDGMHPEVRASRGWAACDAYLQQEAK